MRQITYDKTFPEKYQALTPSFVLQGTGDEGSWPGCQEQGAPLRAGQCSHELQQVQRAVHEALHWVPESTSTEEGHGRHVAEEPQCDEGSGCSNAGSGWCKCRTLSFPDNNSTLNWLNPETISRNFTVSVGRSEAWEERRTVVTPFSNRSVRTSKMPSITCQSLTGSWLSSVTSWKRPVTSSSCTNTSTSSSTLSFRTRPSPMSRLVRPNCPWWNRCEPLRRRNRSLGPWSDSSGRSSSRWRRHGSRRQGTWMSWMIWSMMRSGFGRGRNGRWSAFECFIGQRRMSMQGLRRRVQGRTRDLSELGRPFPCSRPRSGLQWNW